MKSLYFVLIALSLCCGVTTADARTVFTRNIIVTNNSPLSWDQMDMSGLNGSPIITSHFYDNDHQVRFSALIVNEGFLSNQFIIAKASEGPGYIEYCTINIECNDPAKCTATVFSTNNGAACTASADDAKDAIYVEFNHQ